MTETDIFAGISIGMFAGWLIGSMWKTWRSR